MNAIPDVRPTGRAARFVQMLQDFGHLDSESADRLLLGVADTRGTDVHGMVDLPEVKRAAAMLLFPDGTDGHTGILAQDWAILFS